MKERVTAISIFILQRQAVLIVYKAKQVISFGRTLCTSIKKVREEVQAYL